MVFPIFFKSVLCSVAKFIESLYVTITVLTIGCVRVTGETLLGLTERRATLEQVNVFNCFQFCNGLTYFSLSVSTINTSTLKQCFIVYSKVCENINGTKF